MLAKVSQQRCLANVVHDRRVVGPKIVLGDFNEWARRLTQDVLAEKLQSIDLTKYLSHKRTYPGFFPMVHLDHIYYEGARVDLTWEGVSGQMGGFLHEEEIEPGKIGDYKVEAHKRFVCLWAAERGLDAGHVWRVREECIAALDG